MPYPEGAPRFLAMGDIAVAPQLSATEGSGKLLNYMSMAMPVVAFDTPVSREYMGEHGVYAPPGDVAAFAEARILEFGAGLRPAFPDNLPRIEIDAKRISVNGLYRHGFLLAPALAELTLAYVERGAIDNEVMQWS